MIIVLQKDATEKQLQDIVKRVKSCGLEPHVIVGVARTGDRPSRG